MTWIVKSQWMPSGHGIYDASTIVTLTGKGEDCGRIFQGGREHGVQINRSPSFRRSLSRSRSLGLSFSSSTTYPNVRTKLLPILFLGSDLNPLINRSFLSCFSWSKFFLLQTLSAMLKERDKQSTNPRPSDWGERIPMLQHWSWGS